MWFQSDFRPCASAVPMFRCWCTGFSFFFPSRRRLTRFDCDWSSDVCSTDLETKDLADHLREQMRLLDLTPRQQLLAEEFIGNIAEDGYLGATLDEIVNGVNQVLQAHADEAEHDVAPQLYTLAEAEEMLRIIQKLDPPGVGARDLRECLLLQLESRGETDTLAYRLLPAAFQDLQAPRRGELRKRFGLE